MKANHRILLGTGLGFVGGVAVCLCGRMASEDEHPQANVLLSTKVQVNPAPVVESYEGVSRQAQPQTDFFANRDIVPPVVIPAEAWKVTIWYQTLPPQKGNAHDPREYVARRMGLTNR